MPSPAAGVTRTNDMSLVIETLGRVAGSSVVSIGATMFDPTGRVALHEDRRNHIYLVINSFDAQNHGLIVQPKTVQWWRDKEIWPQLSKAIHESPIGVHEACHKLLKFLKVNAPRKVWCNSPSFHLAILRSLFEKAKVELPIEYREEMCYRSIMDAAYPRRELRPARPASLNAFKPHDALGDAIYQAHQIIVTHDYLALPGPDGPAAPLDEAQARATVESLTEQQKDEMLVRLLTGQTTRLTREDVLHAQPELEAEPSTTRSMRPR